MQKVHKIVVISIKNKNFREIIGFFFKKTPIDKLDKMKKEGFFVRL